MFLTQLSLQNFRNFKKRSFEFSPRLAVIVGPNTSGKTNILEAIYMLATGKSFRAELEKEVISYGEEIARISGVTNFLFRKKNSDQGELDSLLSNNKMNFVTPESSLSENAELEVVITTGQVAGKKAPKKKFLVNGVKKRMSDFLGNFFAVLFSPQDLELITNSPSLRRKYLNDVLSVVSQEYRRALLVYEKTLRQRNRILERIREQQAGFSQLEYWNKLLIDNGQVISEKREGFINFVNQHKVPLREAGDFKLVYEKNEISQERLAEKKDKEILLGMTLVGPHRDDFVVKLKAQNSKRKSTTQSEKAEESKNISIYGSRGEPRKSRDLSAYGSRGEQRLAVLWLKVCELAFLEEKTGQKPVLLLDDIFSELDQNCRELVTKIIPNQQTIITTTEKEVVKGDFLKEAKVVEL